MSDNWERRSHGTLTCYENKELGKQFIRIEDGDTSACEACLKLLPTYKLVDELKMRHLVDTEYVDPYETKSLAIEGPAVVLTIRD